MEAELKIWLNYSSKEYERETVREDEADLLAAFKEALGNRRVRKTDCYVSLSSFSIADLAVAKQISAELCIAINCKVEERLTKTELRQVRFARLTIEGDSIDRDPDGNPLNRFPFLACPECRMPDESRMPATVYVSAKQMLRRRQDGVYGVTLPTKREVFSCSCGVFVASERVKRIFEILQQPFKCTPVETTPATELPIQYWAIHPLHRRGKRRFLKLDDPCHHCGQPRRCHLDVDAETNALWPNRLVLQEEAISDLDFVCCETWFGDRTRRPSESFDFLRDVFVSGRLYELLLRAKIRGLVPPEEFVSFGNAIPFVENKTAEAWVKSKLALLKSEGLLR